MGVSTIAGHIPKTGCWPFEQIQTGNILNMTKFPQLSVLRTIRQALAASYSQLPLRKHVGGNVESSPFPVIVFI